MSDTYEIHAIRYARHDRKALENYIGSDDHDTDSPLDYFVWAISNAERTIVLDTGFAEDMATKRARQLIRPVGEGLKAIGIDPASVEDVIVSHMHYDHAGNLDLFPRARFHVQDAEMEYVTGRCMCHRMINHAFEAAHVATMVHRVFEGRVCFHDGEDQIAPGITVHRVGGHTKGLQVTRVKTARGWVVLASDAAHLYGNLLRNHPFPVLYNMGDYLEGLATVRRLAASPDHVIPGHDPLVLEQYPPAKAGLDGVVRVDVAPKS